MNRIGVFLAVLLAAMVFTKPPARDIAPQITKPRQGTDPSAPARNNKARVWKAVSGDTVSLDGRTYRLSDVSCPPADTTAGRDAKALLNTFLRAGYVECTPNNTGSRVNCRANGKSVNSGMIASGLCR